jgi:hypothetical protein
MAACGTPFVGQAKPPPTVTASVSPSSFPSPSGTPVRAPDTFTAVTRDGRIARVSAATGQVVTYLTEALPGGGPLELALTADRKTIYFSRGDGTCASHLATVAVGGGPENPLRGSGLHGPELWPAVRPAGTEIAFARYDCATHKPSLIVASLGSGSEQHFVAETVAFPGWSSDGSRLAYSDDPAITVLDVNAGGAVTSSHRLPSIQGCQLTHPAFVPQTQLVAVAEACGVQGPNRQVKIVTVDPNSGEVRNVLLTLRTGMELVSMSFDASGQFVLYETTASIPSETVIYQASPVQLYWFANGRSQLISADSHYGDAVW